MNVWLSLLQILLVPRHIILIRRRLPRHLVPVRVHLVLARKPLTPPLILLLSHLLLLFLFEVPRRLVILWARPSLISGSHDLWHHESRRDPEDDQGDLEAHFSNEDLGGEVSDMLALLFGGNIPPLPLDLLVMLGYLVIWQL